MNPPTLELESVDASTNSRTRVGECIHRLYVQSRWMHLLTLEYPSFGIFLEAPHTLTGTAQNPHGDDHSIFIGFAPKNNPKIAIAVYVENGGYGSKWAAPIASLISEKYITNSISNTDLEKEMINGYLIK